MLSWVVRLFNNSWVIQKIVLYIINYSKSVNGFGCNNIVNHLYVSPSVTNSMNIHKDLYYSMTESDKVDSTFVLKQLVIP